MTTIMSVEPIYSASKIFLIRSDQITIKRQQPYKVHKQKICSNHNYYRLSGSRWKFRFTLFETARASTIQSILSCLLVSLLLVDSFQPICNVGANQDANRLYEDLMMSYNRFVRPVQNDSDTLVVKLGLKLSQLIDVVSILIQYPSKSSIKQSFDSLIVVQVY